MAKKKSPAPKKYDEELQNAVIDLLDTGDDTGCEGTVVVQVEEFRRVMGLIKDRTGVEHGSVSDENTSNSPGEDDDDEDDDDFSGEDDDDDFDDDE